MNEVTVTHKIERPVGLLRIMRSVLGAWFSGRPIVVMTGPLEIPCFKCGAVTFSIEKKK